jgi:hypothetical protein
MEHDGILCVHGGCVGGTWVCWAEWGRNGWTVHRGGSASGGVSVQGLGAVAVHGIPAQRPRAARTAGKGRAGGVPAEAQVQAAGEPADHVAGHGGACDDVCAGLDVRYKVAVAPSEVHGCPFALHFHFHFQVDSISASTCHA